MNRRIALTTVVVGLLVLTAGCSMFFGGISDEELDREQEYDDLRERNATVAIDVDSGGFLSSGEYRAVYDLDGTEELSLYRSQLYGDQALDIHSVRYWYPNGTEVTGSELHVDQGQSSTEIRVPDENGTIAFSGDAGRQTFDHPAPVSGSYDVTLPPHHRTTAFLFGDVTPGGYERTIEDDRERLTWEENDSSIYIRFYQTRDIPVFVGLVVIALILGGAGIAYSYRQVKRLEARRKEMGLDIDDESDRKPPPGRRR